MEIQVKLAGFWENVINAEERYGDCSLIGWEHLQKLGAIRKNWKLFFGANGKLNSSVYEVGTP